MRHSLAVSRPSDVLGVPACWRSSSAALPVQTASGVLRSRRKTTQQRPGTGSASKGDVLAECKRRRPLSTGDDRNL
jgi:hypothetical protein